MMWYDFRATVGEPGTAVPLWDARDDRYESEHGAIPQQGRDIELTAIETNAGVIVVGGEFCSAAKATRQGRAIYPGQSLEIDSEDFRNIWMDGVTLDDGLRVSYRGTPV